MRASVQQFSLVIAVCVGSGVAHLATSTMPFQVGALMDGTHRSASEAGLFGLLQVGALAAGMILISTRIDRVAPRRIAVGSCLLAALANFCLYSCDGFYAQLALAIFAGLGYGFVFAATVAGAAANPEPDRLYAIGNGGALLMIVGLMAVLPLAAAHFGALGIFGSLAGLVLVCSPFFRGFRRGKRLPTGPLSARRIPGAKGLLFAWAVFSTGTGALYAFAERIGKAIPLPPLQIGWVLSSGVFVGLLGTATAAVLGGKVNRPKALVLGMCGSALACLLMGFAVNLALFAAGVFAYWVFYMFLYSYLLGTAAVLDPTGRVGTLGGGLERLGYAAGAGVGGLLAEHSTYSSTGVLGFAGCLLGLAFGYPSLFRALKRRGGEAPNSPAVVIAP